jgi:hypothetical protein
MIVANKAKPLGERNRNIGRERLRRILREKSPSPCLISFKELFPMG